MYYIYSLDNIVIKLKFDKTVLNYLLLGLNIYGVACFTINNLKGIGLVY